MQAVNQLSFQSKLPNIGLSIFAKMSGLAAQYNAINLSQGFPDFDCNPILINKVCHYMNKGYNQYAPMPGIIQLRETIAQKTEYLYQATYNPDTEITIMPGATLGIFAALMALINKDDEVIILDPSYDCYAPSVTLAGGVPIHIDLNLEDYSIPWEKIKQNINTKTKCIIINSPHNPTGTVLSTIDIIQLESIVSQNNIWVLSDEVYEHIIFDNIPHLSICKSNLLKEKSVIVSSFGKTYHTTGWKMGYILAPQNMMLEIRKVYQFMAFSANTPIQFALNDILNDKDLYLELSQFYQSKRDYFASGLSNTNFKLLPCNGSYFQLVDYSFISNDNDIDFSTYLTKEKGIATIPISVFYNNNTDKNILRLCFAKTNTTLDKAIEKLCKI